MIAAPHQKSAAIPTCVLALWDIDTGHDLVITEPDAVTKALLEVAAA